MANMETQDVTAVKPHGHATRRMRPPHWVEGSTMTDVDVRLARENAAAEAKSKRFVKGLMLVVAVTIVTVIACGASVLYGMNLMASFATTHTTVVSVPTDYYGPGEVFVRVPKGRTSGGRVRILNHLLDELMSNPVSMDVVRKANPNLDLDNIEAGTVIRVPVPVAVHSDGNLSTTNVMRQETTEFPSITLGSWFQDNPDDWKYDTHVQ